MASVYGMRPELLAGLFHCLAPAAADSARTTLSQIILPAPFSVRKVSLPLFTALFSAQHFSVLSVLCLC